MVPALRFKPVFPGQEAFSIDLPLLLGLQLPGRYDVFNGRLAKLVCLWLMMRLRVA